ncbi:MAG TPA: DMT family transporter [Geminicoccaceae bacterium]
MTPAVRAALLMLVGATCVSVMNVTIRLIVEEVHPFQAAFFRNLFGLIVLLPFLGRHWIQPFRTRMRGRLALSGLGHLVAMLAYFTAIAHMPLADVTALSFTKPLFATVGAALILGEVVRARRWAAVAAGFAGVLIVLQPGAATVSPYAGLVLLSTLSIAAVTLMIKRLTATDGAVTIVLYQSLFLSLYSLPLCLLHWQMPDGETWLLMGLTGIVGTGSWIAFTRAFALVDASSVMPFEFARLPLTALLAWLLFAEVPTVWTWVGGAVIFASTAYITRRESRAGGAGPAETRSKLARPAADT